MKMTNIEQMLLIMNSGAEKNIPNESKIHLLKDELEIYLSPFKFKVGDIITPRAISAIKGHGDPHIILEIEDFGKVLNGDPSENMWGSAPNIRVAVWHNGAIGMYWVESFHFERWENYEKNKKELKKIPNKNA